MKRFALVACWLPLSAGAAVIHYVQSTPSAECAPGEVCIAIGVPVPLPVSSQTPVTGFRAYAPLIAGLQDLATQNSAVASFQSIGKTAGNGTLQRDIWSFRIGDADALTAEGFPEPAFLQNGTIHAREWVAPEVAAGYIERLLGNRADHGLYQYLVENVHSVSVPVLNVDGFLQTQRYPQRAQQSTCSEDSSDEPRDGRLRRKNMNADGVPVDEDLLTLADATLGVDVNRNNPPWWGGVPGSSGTPCSLVYRGVAAASERETQALQAAAALGPANRLRLFVDTHSYGRDYLAADTGNARRNALQQQLAQRMSAVAGGRYGYGSSPAGSGIGSTDEYFANTYQIPAYTLEVEPTVGGLSDYPGGINVSNSGFILPASEVPRVRTELTNATVLGVYRQAGPPSVAAVQVRDNADGHVVFAGQWAKASATTRAFQVDTPGTLQAGHAYSIWIAFNKPMRVENAGVVAQYPGQNVTLPVTYSFEGVAANGSAFTLQTGATTGSWRAQAGGAPSGYLRYADDAYSHTFTVAADAPLANASSLKLAISVTDFSGQALDSNPATVVDWHDGAWSGYEDGNGAAGDQGGTDRSIRLVGDGTPPPPPPPTSDGGGGALGVGLLTLGLLATLARRRRPQR